MNSDQVGGIIRAVMAAFSGWALEHGFTQDQWLAITGGVLAAITVAWSYYSNSTKNLIVSVADSPDVHTVVVKDPALANEIPSPKVVSP